METIYKYELSVIDFQIIDMPKGAEILSVQIQPSAFGGDSDRLFLWVKIDTSNELEPKRIRIFGTGNPMEYEHELNFIGTVQMNNYSLVWHVFENIMKEQK